MTSKLKMHSPDLTEDNIAKIAALFPNCISESRDEQGRLKQVVDFDLLRQELSGVIVEGEQERYRLDWVGKKEAILAANAPIAKTLRPCREESVNFDTTENLFIEGDNLDALKLLQENYLGKVKMIYIDPPYNTGKDFIYNDDFAESSAEFFVRSQQFDEEGNRLIANTESNGRFHSDWLSMMYSRLKLARNLLTDDGVIFISCDDNEQANLKRLCDEIFGEQNFISTLIWSLGTGTQAGHFVRAHEYILTYFLDKNNVLNFKGGEGFIEHSALKKISAKNPSSEFDFPSGTRWDAPDGTELTGKWGESEQMTLVHGRMIAKDGKLLYPVTLSAGYAMKKQMISWFSGNETFDTKGQKVLSFYFNKNGILRYEKERSVVNPSTVLTKIASTKNGTDEIFNLFGKKVFNYPKPTEIIKFLANLILQDNDIIVDFFAGSASTAESVLKLNIEKNIYAKFILIQIPEKIDVINVADKEKEANQNAVKFCQDNNLPVTIAEISKERIRRAADKIRDDFADKLPKDWDGGFRVLKVDSTNMKDVYYRPDEVAQSDLLDMVSHIKEERSGEDLLFQVMLDWGLPLSLPIQERDVDGKKVYFVGEKSSLGYALAACFDELSEAVIQAVAAETPQKFVSVEYAISKDADKTNIKEWFKQLSPETDVKFI